jgi:hypothetical protein
MAGTYGPPTLNNPGCGADAAVVVVGTPYAAARALYVGTGGNITLTTLAGNSVQFLAVPSGFMLNVGSTEVTAATAAGIVAIF